MSFTYTVEMHTLGEMPTSVPVESVEHAFEVLHNSHTQPYAAWLRIRSFDYVWTLDMQACKYQPTKV